MRPETADATDANKTHEDEDADEDTEVGEGRVCLLRWASESPWMTYQYSK